jgi:hypothetical protein
MGLGEPTIDLYLPCSWCAGYRTLTQQVPECESRTETSSPQVVLGRSVFKSKIKLGKGGSVDSGNKAFGHQSMSIKVEGSEFGADIEGDENVKVDEGNKIDGRIVTTEENGAKDQSQSE